MIGRGQEFVVLEHRLWEVGDQIVLSDRHRLTESLSCQLSGERANHVLSDPKPQMRGRRASGIHFYDIRCARSFLDHEIEAEESR